LPDLGESLGAGGSSEVYAWGSDRVVKLFRSEYAYALERELECATAVHGAGIVSPAVHGVVHIGGRRGIVFERVDGPTLLEQLLHGDRSAADVGRVLAALHLTMHEVSVSGLRDLAVVLNEQGHEVPSGTFVFHGDFHPGNVIVAATRFCTIDWVNAHVAPRAADVARSVMAVRYQALRPDQDAGALERERRTRATILDAYLASYAAAVELDGIASWVTHAARALLRAEPASADAADLHALVDGRYADVAEPVLRRLFN
jgi:aminoglycoside phosphotransferase (APT) family kinase protein